MNMKLRRTPLIYTLQVVFALCFVFLCAGVAHAQSASLTGTVTDPSGAVIRGATVELQNVLQGTSYTTTTNDSGVYSFPIIPPGQYAATVSQQGFKQVKLVGIVVNVQAQVEHDFQLQPGSVSTSVQVTAGANVINTTDGSVSTVIDRHFVENLPLNGRSFQSLLYLTPGVSMNIGTGATGSNLGTQGQFIVNGQRADANYWIIDGVSGNIGMAPNTPGAGAAGAVGAVNALGGTSALISVDALQEFRVVTSNYAPEFGHVSGGQVILESRAGSNQFHGAAFEYFRNSDLDATDWFADYYRLPKALESQNDFGGVVGGPILKDRAFFFFSYEGLRLSQPFTQVSDVPTLAARAAAVPGMQPFFNMYPVPAPGAPETSPGSDLALYTATFSNPSSADAYSLRLDGQPAKKLHLFGRIDFAPSSYALRGGGSFAANSVNHSQNITKTATVGATWAISPQVVNDTRVNYSISGANAHNTIDTFGGGTLVPANGLPSPHTYADSLFAFIPVAGPGLSEYAGLHGKNYQHQTEVVDTLSAQKGDHSLKFGVDYRRLTPSYGQAEYELIPIFFSMGSMLAGSADLGVVSHYGPGRFLFQNLGVFAQDTWRVNPRLNLTYGLRWDIDYAPDTTEGIALSGLTGYNLNDLSNLALAPGTPAYKTHYGNVAPRVGGAYTVRTDPGKELVLRGGFGVFYSMASTQVVNGYAMDEPFYPYGTNAFFSPMPFPVAPTDPAAQLPPIEPPSVANGNALFGLDPNLKVPYAMEWNLALEQSLGTSQTFSLSYIGSVNRDQPGVSDVTNPNPNYVRAYLINDTGSANYNGLQVQFQRRLSHGLQAIAGYTWSHCIDTGSYGAYGNTFGSPANANANRGDCDYDLRNLFSAAITYQFPAWQHDRFTRAVTGGWATDDIFQLFSGPPIDVTDGNFPAIENAGTSAVIRPDSVPGQPRYLTGSQYPGGKALNRAAFTDPPSVFDPAFGGLVPTRQGTVGRNSTRAYGLEQWNFALHRDFPIYHELRLQFRAEFFNLLNHPNFGAFNSNFQTTNNLFGLSTQMLNSALGGNQSVGAQSSLYQPGGPRSGQLALKFIF